ncbi:MAG TPA: hypothetical protein EYM91_02740, partial [Acidobacteria bacterium]|nr:hypothetical protein [Acidobacteriota bacterium]
HFVWPHDRCKACHRFLSRAGGRAFTTKRELLGFYHSHPDHPARPSQHDLAHAWPFFVYVILAVQQGDPAELTAWRLLDDRSAFGVVDVIHGALGRHRT